MARSDQPTGIADTVMGAGATAATPGDARSTEPAKPGSVEGDREDIGKRFQLLATLGRGGMGEVELAKDRRIGREVAMKRMRAVAPTQEQLDRFVREARVQGGLEHPAIVPVHDFGVDREGRPFIVMKRLVGTTLAQKIGDGVERAELLRAFVDVCLAIEFAHTRGIVHRDLKPANVMLGEFGETYVIDWGVAHATAVWRARLGEPASAESLKWRPPDPGLPEPPDEDGPDDSTRVGAVIGTPAYMAPEQMLGEPATAAVDIYALGCILFEVLAGEPLHSAQRGLSSVADAVDARPSRVKPDVPPELDAICVRATAREPAQRYASARALGEAVQDFVDGDRDEHARMLLVEQHLGLARAAMGRDDEHSRRDAMRAAARVLAVKPDQAEAGGIMARMLLEPPKKIPAELEAELQEQADAATKQRAKIGTYAYLSVVALWAVIPAMTVRSWPWLVAFYATLGANAVFSVRSALTGKIFTPASLVGNIALAIVWSRLFGPFMLTPVFICGVMLAIVANPWMIRRTWAVLAWTTIAAMAPVVLETVGVLEPTWRIHDGTLTTTSTIFSIHGNLELGVLIGLDLMFMLVVAGFALSLRRAAVDAQRRVTIQAWHLRQIVTEAAPLTVSSRRGPGRD